MRTDRPAHTKAALAAVLAASAILVAACGASGGSESSDGGGATTTAASDGGATTTTAAPRTTTTAAATTTTAAAEGGDLVGTWTADAQSILGANLANLGGNAGLACSGPVTLTFNDDGTFTHKSQATCSRGSISATATIDSSGRYRVDGDTIRILAARNAGSMEIMGRTQPMSTGWAVGAVPYTLDGDTLEIHFSNSAVGDVTQTYTRS